MKTGNFCPLIQKKCVEHKCAWYTQVRGLNPNTGQEIDNWGCAVGWMPILAIENSQQSRQTGAAVESFRNEVAKANQVNQQLYVESINQGIIPATIAPVSSTLNILDSGEE